GRHPLQPVVADGAGGANRFVGVAWIELDMSRLETAALRRGVSPDASEAIGLQFQRDRRAALTGTAIARGALAQTGQVLHVMTELVSDYVRLGEITRRAEAACELVEEAEIEIHLPIGRAIERAGRRLREAACRLNRVAEQHRTRPLVLRPEAFGPHVLHVFRDGAHEVGELFFRRRALNLTRSSGAR